MTGYPFNPEPKAQHTSVSAAAAVTLSVLLAIIPATTSYATQAAPATTAREEYAFLVSKAAEDPDRCLRASRINDELSLSPCTGDGQDSTLAQWKARGQSDFFQLVNRYRTSDGTERCLINVGWQPRMGACDSSRTETFWIARDGEAGHVRLQNAYSSEQRCVQATAAGVTLQTCTEQPLPDALWSTDVLPQDPAYQQEQRDKFPQPRVIELSALPTAEAEQQRVKQNHRWADWQPTGFYLNPQTELTLNVAGDLVGANLELSIGTPALVLAWDHAKAENLSPAFIRLNPGANKVWHPRGGLISLRYTTASIDDSAPPIVVTLGPQAEPVPYFELGKTGLAQWRTMLEVSTIPLVQLSSSKVIIAATLQSMRQAQDQDVQAMLTAYGEGIDAQSAIAGLDGSAPGNRPSPLRPLVVETRQGVNPNATHYRAAMPFPMTALLSASGVKRDWGVWHELGHHRQSPIWTWDRASSGEVTVNIYTLAALRHWHGDDFPVPPGGPGPNDWDRSQIYLAAPDDEREFENLTKTESLIRQVMFEQLRVVFGDGFYPALEKAVRAQGDPGDPTTRKRLFQVQASKASEVDLSDYFVRWGLRPDPDTLAAIAALGLPKPVTDPSTKPVFGGSPSDRMLQLWGFWLPGPERLLHVDGYASPVGALIRVQTASGSWSAIGAVDEHLHFDNGRLSAGYLSDGQEKLVAKVGENSESMTFTVVERPEITQLSALRTPDGKIWLKGQGKPTGAVVEAGAQNGSWPGVAGIAGGLFENRNLNNGHLNDGNTVVVARLAYQGRHFKETYTAPVAQVLAVSGWLNTLGQLHVDGRAAPPLAAVEALTRDGTWEGIAAVREDGSFSNHRLTTRYLRDGVQTLEVRIKLADGRETKSMEAMVTLNGKDVSYKAPRP